jgi:hypothetical protein
MLSESGRLLVIVSGADAGSGAAVSGRLRTMVNGVCGIY